MRSIDEVSKLIVDRSKEYGFIVALLELSNAGVRVLQAAEAIVKVPQTMKKSVRMEYVRADLKKQKEVIEQELDSLVELLVKVIRNEADE